MTDRPEQPLLHRRKVLLGLGGAGLAATAAVLARSAPELAGAAQATSTAAASWTPPTIPKPPPTPGGVAPTVVGKAPAAAPPSGSPSSFPVEEPGAPPRPAATPAAATATATPAATVTLTPDYKFDPAQVTINKGDTILWKNAGRSPQTVTDDPALAANKSNAVLPSGAQPWDSGILNSGATYSHTFDVAGDYVYFSMPQEKAGMVGKITVKG